MKNISLYIILVIGMLSATSCEKFLDVNEDQDQPFTSTPDSLLPAVIGKLVVSHFDHGDVTAYFTQQVATLGAWDKYKDRWDYVDANRIAQWRRHYHDVSINAMHVIESAQNEGNAKNYEAVATIAYATSTLMTTDLFGDIAYTEAFKGKPNAKYDAQEDVYGYIQSDLDKGIALADEYLNSPQGSYEMTRKHDNIYGGDIQKWKAYAYALKARAALHLTPNVNTNYSEVLAFAQLALDNGFETAEFDYSISSNNDWEINPWGGKRVDPGTWETAVNILDVSAPTNFMVERALNFDVDNNLVTDPRQPLLMAPRYVPTGGDIENPEYLYVVSGGGKIGTLDNEDYPDLYVSYMTGNDSKLPFMTLEELYFIISEASFSNDINKSYQYFIEGITEHMKHVGVANNLINDYLATEFVPQSASELSISKIMMQKYVATYLQGETWVDMRRYGHDNQIYKGLERPLNLVDYFEDDVNEAWLQRLPYDTETEEVYNKEQLVEMGAYQNTEWLKKKMFWAK